MKYLRIILFSILSIALHIQTFAQFTPGDIGYNPAMENLYKELRIGQIFTYQQNEEFFDGEFMYTITMVDGGGRIVEEKFPSMESFFSTDDEGYGDDTSFILYQYRPDGKIAQITSLGFDYEAEDTYFTYDAKGKLTEKIISSGEARRYTFEYDKNDNIIKANGETPVYTEAVDGKPVDILNWRAIDYYTYKWNDKKQLIEKRFYYEQELYSIFQFIYSDAHLMAIHVYSDEKMKKPDSVFNYTYNPDGTLQKMNVSSEFSDINVEYRFEYRYY
ncbi:MAG: hypothetical protein ACK4IY_00040 [Chitinophagales bacterium]